MTAEQIQQESVRPTAGQLLRDGREKADKSIDDIAKTLRLRPQNIEDIEADRVDPKISLTFYKGYLKLYAKSVGVSEQRVLEAFASETKLVKEPAKLQSFSRRVSKQANDDRLMMITYLVIAIVVALVIWWWFQQSTTLTDSSSDLTAPLEAESVQVDDSSELELSEAGVQDDQIETQLQPVATDSEQQQLVDALTTETQSAELPETQELSEVAQSAQVVEEDNQALADDAISVEAEDVASQQLAAQVELIFEFGGDCWMNLTDATGEAIAYGVKKSGRIMPVNGVPPFQVILGAPEVVQISYNGEPVNMSNFTAGQTARFSLPLAD